MKLAVSSGLGGPYTDQKQEIFDRFVKDYNVRVVGIDRTNFSSKIQEVTRKFDNLFVDHARLAYTKDHRTLLITQPYEYPCRELGAIKEELGANGYGIEETESWYYPAKSRAFVIYKLSRLS